jgi:hypothetical protein
MYPMPELIIDIAVTLPFASNTACAVAPVPVAPVIVTEITLPKLGLVVYPEPLLATTMLPISNPVVLTQVD